jgi:hypothetical protein
LLALASAALAGQLDRRLAYVALAATAAFLLGFCDDRLLIGPGTKFGQLAIAAGRQP